jgi:hypothetical protein
MKEQVKDLWVAALRSGEYKQTQTVLHDGDGYCCLGVLCRVLGKQFAPAYTNHERAVYLCEGSTVLLPRVVRDEAGMKSDSGAFGVARSLADLNDKGVPFDEIASLISEHWETL